MKKQCFVIMPFKQHGSAEFAHYRALFDNVIKPAVEKFGYEVTRADDHKRVGSITKDIIVPLASADLVVADLTEVNPNVFYELGVRHALRGFGTIMIMDETQASIPFDVNAYRVIKFRSTLEGIGVLGRELASYVEQIEKDPLVGIKDNLVHDWLPSLPTNVLDSSLGSEEGALRKQIQELRRVLGTYEKQFGSLSQSTDAGPSALQVVQDAFTEAKMGLVASSLVERATDAAQRGETAGFLEALSQILQLRTSRPTVRHIIQLTRAASVVGLDAVSEAVVEHAQRLYPSNKEIKLTQFSILAHSDNPGSRERARQGMLAHLGITKQDDSYRFSRDLGEDLDTGVLGIMLDTFHEDGLHDEALKLLAGILLAYPENSGVVRNYARALENTGKKAESLIHYRRANFFPDADDTAAVWFANKLHNNRRFADAAEVYLLGCLRDPDDSTNFLHYAEEVSRCFSGDVAGSLCTRTLPESIGDPRSVIAQAVIAAISIGSIVPDSIQRMRGALRRVELDVEQLEESLAVGHYPPNTRQLRMKFLKEQFEAFRSDLTNERADFHP